MVQTKPNKTWNASLQIKTKTLRKFRNDLSHFYLEQYYEFGFRFNSEIPNSISQFTIPLLPAFKTEISWLHTLKILLSEFMVNQTGNCDFHDHPDHSKIHNFVIFSVCFLCERFFHVWFCFVLNTLYYVGHLKASNVKMDHI